MGMVVQHNLTAMNSNRMLGVTSSAQAKSTEKLSSGYKINRAADDAAGLSISEKMRKQIRGLTQASANAQDGISAVQTAEGALTEVHDMLQRMNELAVKAANGTNSESDRTAIQDEIDQLVTEIDRVSTTTKFNETYLLKGENADGTIGKLSYTTATANVAVGGAAGSMTFDEDGIATASMANKADAYTVATNVDTTTTAADARSVAVTIFTANAANGSTLVYSSAANTNFSAQTAHTAGAAFVGDTANSAGYLTTTASVQANTTVATTNSVAATTLQVGASTYGLNTDLTDDELEAMNTSATAKFFNSAEDMAKAIKATAGKDLKDVSISGTEVSVTAFADENSALDISLHVGADSSKDNKIGLDINMMSARGLGVNGLRVDGDNSDNATAAIDTIAAAVQKVSSQRSTLGAVQNRLEHTINNLDNVVENTTSAESAIRDTDMASEMVKYSNNNILAQAGTSMLAQANQSNQNILSLLG